MVSKAARQGKRLRMGRYAKVTVSRRRTRSEALLCETHASLLWRSTVERSAASLILDRMWSVATHTVVMANPSVRHHDGSRRRHPSPPAIACGCGAVVVAVAADCSGEGGLSYLCNSATSATLAGGLAGA